MQNNLADKDNLNPEYRFILDNLDILITDVNWGNIRTKFPERKEFSHMQNQRLINLRRQIVRDVSEGVNEFIYFNAHQWESIVNKLKETESAI